MANQREDPAHPTMEAGGEPTRGDAWSGMPPAGAPLMDRLSAMGVQRRAREHRQKIIPAFRFYTFRSHEPPPVVGHNPLAGMTYTVLFLMFLVQALTGFALDAVEDRGGWMWWLSGWVFGIAPIGTLRLVHHLVMWLTWGFVVHHVYSAVLMDHIERSGVVSSMLSGWKNVPWGHR